MEGDQGGKRQRKRTFRQIQEELSSISDYNFEVFQKQKFCSSSKNGILNDYSYPSNYLDNTVNSENTYDSTTISNLNPSLQGSTNTSLQGSSKWHCDPLDTTLLSDYENGYYIGDIEEEENARRGKLGNASVNIFECRLPLSIGRPSSTNNVSDNFVQHGTITSVTPDTISCSKFTESNNSTYTAHGSNKFHAYYVGSNNVNAVERIETDAMCNGKMLPNKKYKIQKKESRSPLRHVLNNESELSYPSYFDDSFSSIEDEENYQQTSEISIKDTKYEDEYRVNDDKGKGFIDEHLRITIPNLTLDDIYRPRLSVKP